jgi:hypothetical protein
MKTSGIRLASTLLLGIVVFSLACVAPNCDRPDKGTCVNACCKLQFQINGDAAGSPAMLVKQIAASLAKGGPDGRYFSVENNTIQPWSSANDVVIQAIHTTVKHTYNDTVHFAISPPAGQGHDAITLHAFSHSQDFIAGNFAYSDRGQNYKNIVTLVQSLNLPYTESTVFGCPEPAAVKPLPAEVEVAADCGCPEGMYCPGPAPPNGQCGWLGALGYVCGTTSKSSCQPSKSDTCWQKAGTICQGACTGYVGKSYPDTASCAAIAAKAGKEEMHRMFGTNQCVCV